MADYIDSEYLSTSETAKVGGKNSSTKELLKRPIDDKSLQSYGLSKPQRIIIKARLINDPS
ncbi:hypothetical protein TUM3792_41720 [Shewanella sp. MBTL60-007]|nr:hypothetical protein TUM3792_41720 [Shewanella sp. MBTL60-007]